MAHQIYFDGNGKASMAYRGDRPWWDGGNEMDENATLEDWIKACGFDYSILRGEVFYQDQDGVTRKVPDRYALYRSDTGAPIEVMSGRYKVVQPKQIMESFRRLCDSEGWEMETAGVLKGGAKYWALARMGRDARIGEFVHKMYHLLATSADGTLPTIGMLTDVRVVCANTMSVAMRDKTGKSCSIRHTSAFDPEVIHRDLGLIDVGASWSDHVETLERAADVQVSLSEARDIFAELLRPKGERREVEVSAQNVGADDFASLLGASTRSRRIIEGVELQEGRAIRGMADLEHSYLAAPGACPGTGYGVLQGVTHWLDHTRGSDDNRLASAWFGQGAQLKERAMDLVASL